jgi:predicted Zn-dependent protease with MMP-like domain
VTGRSARLSRYRDARNRLLPRTSRRAFESLVAEVLDELPSRVRGWLENVAVVVEDQPPHGAAVLGLYEGINRLERGSSYNLVAPDRITLYWRPIVQEVAGGDVEAIRAEVRKTIVHEVAHHFGYDDAELERLGG